MEDNSKEELLQLAKRFGAYLAVKMSSFFSFFQSLDSRSVGAIAGFAVAIVFTWRLMRSSSRETAQPKRSSASPSTSSPTNTTVIQEPLVSTEPNQQLIVNELLHPVKLTLGQIVRQKLSEGRKVTCRLAGVILNEKTPEEFQKQVTVKSSAIEVLMEMSKHCDLYLMERVLDDESEQTIIAALENAGVFSSGSLIKDKILFSGTENGRSSFVRQLEPDWHIDTNPEIISQLSRFIKYQLLVCSVRPERNAVNVLYASSLEEFFGCA